MRLCIFDRQRLGFVEGNSVHDVTAVLDRLPAHRYPLPDFDPLVAALEDLRPYLLQEAARAPAIDVDAVTLLSPIANPGKLIGAPVNYLKHLAEGAADAAIHHHQHLSDIRRIALFLKATSSLVGPGTGVRIRDLERRNDHELELCVVIGRRADRVARQEALDYVAGYCIGLDMTARGPEDRSFRKSIDTYSVLGPWLVTKDEMPDASTLDMKLTVNGQVRQQANTRDLVVGIPELIEWASSFYTLHPGDVIFTGTPEGVGPVNPGDVMDASIHGIGSMTVRVLGPNG